MLGPQEELAPASYKFTSLAASPLLKALLGKPVQVRSEGSVSETKRSLPSTKWLPRAHQPSLPHSKEDTGSHICP